MTVQQKLKAQSNLVDCTVDEKFFPRDVVLQAAYRFIERCYVRLAREKNRKITVTLKGKRKLSKKRLAELASEFENELLNQLVRHKVAERTDKLREIIVGRALLSAQPQQQQEEELDYLEDPLGIAIPWEEKYGDEEQKGDQGQEQD